MEELAGQILMNLIRFCIAEAAKNVWASFCKSPSLQNRRNTLKEKSKTEKSPPTPSNFEM